MRSRRTIIGLNQSAVRVESGKATPLRFIIALLVALTLSLMPLAMANTAHAATATAMAMDHCAGQRETAPMKHQAGAQGCAMACAAVEPMVVQLASQTIPVRPVLSPRLSPRLDGITPDATSPPPRSFPEI